MGIMLEDKDGLGFAVLNENECFGLLHQGSIGRVAVTIGAIPAIFPVNYCVLGGAIYFRTAVGAKLAVATERAVVAFQVDEIDKTYHQGWSVLAVGIATEITDRAFCARLARLPLQPWAPGEKDHYVRIWPEFVSGRRICFSESPSAT